MLVCSRHGDQWDFWSNIYTRDELQNDNSKWIDILFHIGILISIRKLELAIVIEPQIVVAVLIFLNWLLQLLTNVSWFFISNSRLIISINLTDAKFTVVRIKVIQSQRRKALNSAVLTKLLIRFNIRLEPLLYRRSIGLIYIEIQGLRLRWTVFHSFAPFHHALLIFMHLLLHKYITLLISRVWSISDWAFIFKIGKLLNVLTLWALLRVFIILIKLRILFIECWIAIV